MIDFIDNKPPPADMLTECLEGLRSNPKTLPCKYFYDENGSTLFEQITTLEAYYPTRTELSIFTAHGDAIAEAVGSEVVLVELGSGSGMKTIELLRRLHRPRGIALVEISHAALRDSARRLANRFDGLPVWAVCADYTRRFELPPMPGTRRVAFFPGSTIGNFSPTDTSAFLEMIRRLVAPDGGLIIGFDRVKPRAILEGAYNDEEGLTAQFNLNVLAHLNRAGADFDLDAFAHEADFDEGHSRIEMRLTSLRDQVATVAGHRIELAAGEAIITEHCYKFTLQRMEELAATAGLRVAAHWSDDQDWFTVAYLTPRA